MHSIKKYANRKLYHTNRKQYITLDGIAELIQAGEQVQVIDNESGEDITAPILAQVVLQSRGRSKSALPTHLLTDLIQAGGDTISGLRRSVWAAISGESSIDAEIRRRLHQLVTEGLLSAEEGARMLRMMVRSSADDASRALLDLPTSSDVARLRSQVEELASAVEQLLSERHVGHAASATQSAARAAKLPENGVNGVALHEPPAAAAPATAAPVTDAPDEPVATDELPATVAPDEPAATVVLVTTAPDEPAATVQVQAIPEHDAALHSAEQPAAEPAPQPATRPRSTRKSGTSGSGTTIPRARRRKGGTDEV